MTSTAKDWDERYETGFTPWDSGAPSAELKRLLQEYSIAPCRMLEIGCGSGTNAVDLAKLGFQVKAVDFAPLAVERAKQRAAEADAAIDFGIQDLAAPDAAEQLLSGGEPYSFVFDRGVYHCVRREDLAAFQQAVAQVVALGGTYINLSGNANDNMPEDQGPPRVSAEAMLAELGPWFELVQLREFRFDGVVVEGEEMQPLAWSAVWRRKIT